MNDIFGIASYKETEHVKCRDDTQHELLYLAHLEFSIKQTFHISPLQLFLKEISNGVIPVRLLFESCSIEAMSNEDFFGCDKNKIKWLSVSRFRQ
ncbi:CLUMA_CG017403, isoform A [Clunio marinus]|uniref:CLUMA_CG017403, isoform A n=1 Tax=Clunio marinus TaxID=568069 RepID=A0A1J1J0E0_9DIPT|nr:CLUMA_CG017403, isoform A [Clunio marinus]